MAKTKESDIVEWIELSYTTKVWKYLLFEVRTSSTSLVIRTDFFGHLHGLVWILIGNVSGKLLIPDIRNARTYGLQEKICHFFLSKKKFSKAAHFHKRQIPHPAFLIDLQASTMLRCTLKWKLVKEEVSLNSLKKYLWETEFGIIWELLVKIDKEWV